MPSCAKVSGFRTWPTAGCVDAPPLSIPRLVAKASLKKGLRKIGDSVPLQRVRKREPCSEGERDNGEASPVEPHTRPLTLHATGGLARLEEGGKHTTVLFDSFEHDFYKALEGQDDTRT